MDIHKTKQELGNASGDDLLRWLSSANEVCVADPSETNEIAYENILDEIRQRLNKG